MRTMYQDRLGLVGRVLSLQQALPALEHRDHPIEIVDSLRLRHLASPSAPNLLRAMGSSYILNRGTQPHSGETPQHFTADKGARDALRWLLVLFNCMYGPAGVP